MGSAFDQTIICELSSGQQPFGDVRQLLPAKCAECGSRFLNEIIFPYTRPHGTWIVERDRKRFQIFSYYIRSSWFQTAAEAGPAHHHFITHVVESTRALVAMGHWDEMPFGTFVEAPADGVFPSIDPSEARGYDEYGIKSSDLSIWTEAELESCARARRRAIDLLMQCRLADLRGWLVYLGRQIVNEYGRQRLRTGPFCRVQDGPHEGLLLELLPGLHWGTPSVEAWVSAPSLETQREYLGIDASWIDRYHELRQKRVKKQSTVLPRRGLETP
ncbi:MAG: hypothetical protein HY303_00545 [Candidatus Wallbacteria bacterium]|nr:hypothetical protein [Candidatus Wallbacteria bacterium]